MGAVREFFVRLVRTLRPSRTDEDARREIASHVGLLEEEFLRRGLSPADARRQARLAIGGVLQTSERHRDSRTIVLLDDLRRDVRYALRSLARTPGFTFVAILTLALGIGANTAIFSVVHAVLLAPLPYTRGDQLVTLFENVPGSETRNGRPRRQEGVDRREILALRSHSRLLSAVTTRGFALISVAGSRNGRESELVTISGGTLQALDVKPALGRWFTDADEQPGNDKVVILSYPAWQRYFNGSADAIGKTLAFNGNTFSTGIALGTDFTVVGVMPNGFHFPDEQAEFWAPMAVTAPSNPRQRQSSTMMARLADNVSLQAATAEISAIVHATRLATPGAPQPQPGASWDFPDGHAPRFVLERVQDQIGAGVKPALVVLMGAVAFVLLIACANVANLLLARTSARDRELAVRVAVGAGRGRLVRQLLTESLVLSFTGGLSGIVVAAAGVGLFRALATNLARVDLGSLGDMFPRLDAIGIDGAALAFVAAVSILTGLVFGLFPALRHSRRQDMEILRGASSTAAGATRGRASAQSALVVVEVAIAMTVAIGGGLLINSFIKLARVDTGFDPDGVTTFQVGLPGTSGKPGTSRPYPELKRFADDLTARVRQVPGVEAAAYANQLPLVKLQNTTRFAATPFAVLPGAGPAPAPPEEGGDVQVVSRDYLKVMGARLLAGRTFSDGDIAGHPQVVVINRAMAARHFPDKSPVGELMYVGMSPAAPWEIVGVVDDLRTMGLDREPVPQFFLSLDQYTSGRDVPLFPAGTYYAVRTAPGARDFMARINAIAHEMEPLASIENVATMNEIISNEMTRPRMYAVLLGIFAGIAVLLASAGIYGVMAYRVTQRTREIGVRMALGARPSEVLGLVMKHSSALTLIGVVLGLAGAVATTKYLQSLLYGLTPLDTSTFAAVAVLFALVATLASLVPASRATKVDPLIALRAE